MGSKGSSSGGGGSSGATGPTFNSELWSNLLKQLVQPQGATISGGGLAGGISRGFSMGSSVIGSTKQATERTSKLTELERRLRFMESLAQTDQRAGEL